MKTITYNKRAEWDEFISEDTQFIQNIIEKLRARTVLEIPCANGRNLNVISGAAKYAIFGDVNKEMVSAVQNKINMERKNNCSVMLLDLCDLSRLSKHIEIDLILIPQQSFQLLNRTQAQAALINMKKSGIKYIIIDIYDFEARATDLPIYLVKDTFFTDKNEVEWTRKSSIILREDGLIYLYHKYFSRNNSYTATLILENYSRKEIVNLCKQCGFIIEEVFTAYDMSFNDNQGRTIILLRNESANKKSSRN